jgi:hypothetical protein
MMGFEDMGSVMLFENKILIFSKKLLLKPKVFDIIN